MQSGTGLADLLRNSLLFTYALDGSDVKCVTRLSAYSCGASDRVCETGLSECGNQVPNGIKSHFPIRLIRIYAAASPHVSSLVAFIFNSVKIDRSRRGLVPIKHDLLGTVVPAKHGDWEQLDH
jgi:hypothetical protein